MTDFFNFLCIIIFLSAGRLETATALELTKYLVQERDYVPWATALTWFGVFGDRLSLSPVYGRYQVRLYTTH